MMKECIILAGGFGTRLQSIVNDVPKCMAPIAGKPFLHYQLKYAYDQHFDHVVLSLGYKWEIVKDWVDQQEFPFDISYAIEDIPLGTGGALKLSCSEIKSCDFFVFNGDTFFEINTDKFLHFYRNNITKLSIALKPMINFDRYGSVDIDSYSRIIGFNEKKECNQGLINGGVYIINKSIFESPNLPESFSFEKEILEKRVLTPNIYGYISDNYFIDIGIPADYEKANMDFKNKLF